MDYQILNLLFRCNKEFSQRKKVAELIDIHNNWLHDIMTCLSEEEQKQFENFCERLLAAAEKLTRGGENNSSS